jgi:hypothetical protein
MQIDRGLNDALARLDLLLGPLLQGVGPCHPIRRPVVPYI